MKSSEAKNGKVELDVLNKWYQSAYDSSRKIHWNWFVIDQMLKGNQNIKVNSAENVVQIIRQSDRVNYPINKMYAVFRAVRNFVTRNQAVAQVEPKNTTEEAKVYARRATKILERDNQLNNFRRLCKEWVYYGVKYGVGYRQIGFDPQRHCAVRWTIDPFDLWSGDITEDLQDVPYLIKTVKRNMAYLKNKFPDSKDMIAPDNETAADEYKRLSLNLAFNTIAGPTNPLDQQTAIVKECWYRVIDKNSKDGHVNKCTFINGGILDFVETPYDEYPFISYKSEIIPNEEYPDGAMKHVVSPQRLYNMLNTQLLHYNHIVNRGRFIMDNNAGFEVIEANEGQIIKKKPGSYLQAAQVPALNPMLQWQMTNSDDAIQTIGGMHDASTGVTPDRVSSGDAIEALQYGDTNNLSDMRDNYEDSLALEAQWVLKMYSLFEDQGVVMNTDYKEKEKEKQDRYAAVGTKALETTGKSMDQYFLEENGEYCDVCKILPDNQVKVSIASQLGETRQARLNLLLKLVELGLPFKVLLEHLEFPNTGDILERIASETLAEQAVKAMGTSQTQQQPGPGPMPEGAPMPEEIASELDQINQEL